MSRIRIRGSCAIRSSVLPWFVRNENSGAAREPSVFSPAVTDIDIAIYSTRYVVRMYSGCARHPEPDTDRPDGVERNQRGRSDEVPQGPDRTARQGTTDQVSVQGADRVRVDEPPRARRRTRRGSAMNVQPLADRLILEVLEEEEATVSGIVLPDTAREKPQRGRVWPSGRAAATARRQAHPNWTSPKATRSSSRSTAAPRSGSATRTS